MNIPTSAKPQVFEKYKELVKNGVSKSEAKKRLAKELKKSLRAIQALIKQCEADPTGQGIRQVDIFAETSGDYEVEAARTNPFLAGQSTLYDADGNVKLRWEKETFNNKAQAMREMAEAFYADLPKVEPTEAQGFFDSDRLAVYPMGDPHLGMLADFDETGDADFNIKIAERDLCAAVHRLVNTAPSCTEALIINLGDFFHADNMEGRTARSGHNLDTDSRWSKVLKVGVKTIRRCIESALEKHEKVSVINAIGNHDDHSAMMLSVALSNVYEDEPRVNIIDAPTIKHYFKFGNNLFGVHHGHTIKPDRLPLQMAVDRPEDWAAAKERRWFCGHFHTQRVHEIDGVVIEYFRTLAPKDAWHASMGYKAGRDMRAMIFHRNFGLVETHLVSIDMLNKQ